MEVKKRDNESSPALIYRFIKRVQQTGVLREAKKRRFRSRVPNGLKRKLSALHRETKRKDRERAKRLGEVF